MRRSVCECCGDVVYEFSIQDLGMILQDFLHRNDIKPKGDPTLGTKTVKSGDPLDTIICGLVYPADPEKDVRELLQEPDVDLEIEFEARSDDGYDPELDDHGISGS